MQDLHGFFFFTCCHQWLFQWCSWYTNLSSNAKWVEHSLLNNYILWILLYKLFYFFQIVLSPWTLFQLYYDGYQLVWSITLLLSTLSRIQSAFIPLFWVVFPTVGNLIRLKLFHHWRGMSLFFLVSINFWCCSTPYPCLCVKFLLFWFTLSRLEVAALTCNNAVPPICSMCIHDSKCRSAIHSYYGTNWSSK